MTTHAAGEPLLGRRGQAWRDAEAGQVADPVVVKGPGWPGLPAQMGRRTSARRRARPGNRVRSARGKPPRRGYRRGPVSPDQSLARVAISPDVGSPVVGSDRGACLAGRRSRAFRRFRLAAALAAATLLKIWLESVAKMLVQRGRPAETVPDVILRGNSAAHRYGSLGHAMVIFAITILVAPYLKGWWKVLPWALAAAVSYRACTSARTSHWTSSPGRVSACLSRACSTWFSACPAQVPALLAPTGSCEFNRIADQAACASIGLM